jgi:uncharacterized protein YcbX
MLTIGELYIYPIKSLGGISVKEALVTDRGLQYDRRFMLVDADGMFLTQRELPLMATLKTEINGGRLRVWGKGQPAEELQIPLVPASSSAAVKVQVWDDTCIGQAVDETADQWFSRYLQIDCKLVYMPDATQRLVDPQYAKHHEITSFSDGYPILLIGQASLDDLNRRLAEPVPMNRFRPNVVLEGGRPFEEDDMSHFKINEIDFYGVKPCARCQVTTTDQETGERYKEPLKTLATYRQKEHKILFGQNVLVGGTGRIAVGDEVLGL